MSREDTRSVFDGLINKTHVAHALIQVQSGDEPNDVPTSLATVLLLNGTPAQLRLIYEHKRSHLRTWPLSPTRITTVDDRARHMGDVRFQRAYMDYYSLENGKLGGNSIILALSHLVSGPKPLIYGLFGGYGRSLLFLSDGMELQSAIIVVESLVLASVDWSEPLDELLNHPQLETPPDELLSPDTLLSHAAYDGRFSGLMRSGPGFEGVSNILSNDIARSAVLEYIHRLDLGDLNGLVHKLSRLSVALLCTTHKQGQPVFDYYLASLPTFVNCLRQLLYSCQDHSKDIVLVRGVWMLMVLAYITQLRPTMDQSLMPSKVPEGELAWEHVFSGLRQEGGTLEGKYLDSHFLRTLRSLRELDKAFGGEEQVYVRAAWKLCSQWRRWTGFGADREESLNIRL